MLELLALDELFQLLNSGVSQEQNLNFFFTESKWTEALMKSVFPLEFFSGAVVTTENPPKETSSLERHISAVGLGQGAQQAVCNLYLRSNFYSSRLYIQHHKERMS